jgi:hypothetical protein
VTDSHVQRHGEELRVVERRRGVGFLKRPRLAWSLLYGGAAIADVSVRIMTSFAITGVLWTETALLAGLGAATLGLSQRLTAYDGTPRRWPAYMAAFLVLGALRASIWAAGAPVFVANMAALSVAVVGGGVARWIHVRSKNRA